MRKMNGMFKSNSFETVQNSKNSFQNQQKSVQSVRNQQMQLNDVTIRTIVYFKCVLYEFLARRMATIRYKYVTIQWCN